MFVAGVSDADFGGTGVSALGSVALICVLQLPLVNLLKIFPLELLLLLFLLLLCEKQVVLLSASVNRLSLLPCALTGQLH